MNSIRAKMLGTTVEQKHNQGFSRLYECREGIKLRGSFLGTFLDKQKGTKKIM
jgi:hypothetical protein